MLRNILLFLLIAFCISPLSSKAQGLEEALESVFNDFQLMGMSVVVSSNGSISSHHFGLRDLERGLEVNDQTKFRIASISKTFTALGLMKLYDQGAFQLDEDVSPYLGFNLRNPNFPNSPITFRMLLSHTGSIQDGNGYSDFLDATYSQSPIPPISELLLPGGAYFTSNMFRAEEPGSYFAYSNLNFGLIGTLIEALSGQRFDQYMKTEILEPLGVSASFNIQDIPDIDNVAVLYRNIGGWQPQADNYQGNYPTPPDLSGYQAGTNGLFFAPQGGLRASALEVERLLWFMQNEGNGAQLLIGQETIAAMKGVEWDFDGTNGDNYFGLFNRWGLGLHHANINQGDGICLLQDFGAFLGHPGEAYGLISDAYFGNEEPVSFVLMINGSWPGYQAGNQTAFYTVEEAIFAAVCSHMETLGTGPGRQSGWSVSPNPSSGTIIVEHPSKPVFDYTLRTMNGQFIQKATRQQTAYPIELGKLPAGLYLLELHSSKTVEVIKIIVR